MFHITEMGMKRARHFCVVYVLVGCVDLVGWEGGMGGKDRGFDSHQLNHAFSFSYFLFFLFFPIIFVYFMFAYLYICISVYFQKCSAHEQYALYQEDISYNRKGYEASQAFLSGISVASCKMCSIY
jgi:hypothetical protein